MRYYRMEANGDPRLVVEDGETAYDLTAARPTVTDFKDLAHVGNITNSSVDDVARELRADATVVEIPDGTTAGVPLDIDEVWAAGVTYEISEQAREAESGMPEIYIDVYDAERPEIFFKGTPRHVVGPGDAVGIRGDSEWNVPEPELGVVLHQGDIVGYTVGNDMSSRSIEGENPLYLPQAKVYDRSCALGPCIATPDTVGDPHELQMSMTIDRGDDRLYDESTTTAEMVRTCSELVDYLTRHNAIPESAVLLTGTSLVPSDEFTLSPDDEISIEIEKIGQLQNSVTEV